MSAVIEGNVYSDLRIKLVVRIVVQKKWGYGFLTSIIVRRSDDKEYEFSYADLPRLRVNDVEDMYLLQVQDKLHHLLLEFLKDFNNALLMFIRRTVIKNRNKLSSGNKRLKGRDWTDYDVKSSREMLKKIDETLRHKEQLRRLEEYVGGRPNTINLILFHIRLFIKGKKNGRMMIDSIDNGPLVYPTIEEIGQTRPKKYSELTKAQQLQDDCDVQATNIILHGLPSNVYALVNHQEVAKDIWDRGKLLMKGTELSYQEREYRLYNLFDKFPSIQVNTKFLNAPPPDWSKFVTNVKLAKSLYTTNHDQLYAYLSQHERHANEVRIMRESYSDPLALVANSKTLYNPSQSPQHSGSSINENIQLTASTKQQPFKMEESQFNKFKEDKLRVLLALEIEELLQPQGETMELVKQRL
ncbi:hypothetical protein Tco_0157120 [Tanacetum coccineum]